MAPRVTIGRVARETGVPAKTIRYYEQIGVLPRPARTAAGYRLYDQPGIERLRLISRARSLGLPLQQLTSLMTALDGGLRPGARPRLRTLAGKQLASVKNRISELEALRAQLEHIVQGLRAPVSRRAGEPCRCLESPNTPAHRQRGRPRTSAANP
jgi:DNA-binding transcriptional MerR regulator